MAKLTDKQAQDELKRLIDEIDNVRKKPRLSPKFKSWQVEASELLEKVFGRSAKQVKDFDRIPYSLATFSNQTPDSKFDEAFQQGLKTAAIALSSAIKEIQTNGVGGKKPSAGPAASAPAPEPVEEIEKIAEPAPTPAVAPKAPAREETKKPLAIPATSAPAVEGAEVLVFAGNAKDTKTDLVEFLSKIGLSPVSENVTVDEHNKLLSTLDVNPDAEFAVVLLGFGGAESNNDAYGLGLLVGRLGHERVCVVIDSKTTGIDTFSGISYVPVDAAGAWKFMMIKNLKMAGFQVDANLAL